MAKVMKVQALGTDGLGRVWPAGQLVEVAATYRAAPRTREQQRVRPGQGLGRPSGRLSLATGGYGRSVTIQAIGPTLVLTALFR
jgi:hypothetical protein